MADASSVARQGKQAAQSDWVAKFGRVGYAAKGVVYIIVGVLAAQAAFGGGGATTGSRGAIRSIADEPFGQVLLVLTALGLAGYAVWRLVMAGVDLFRVKELLGHADISTTMRYAHLAPKGFENDVERVFGGDAHDRVGHVRREVRGVPAGGGRSPPRTTPARTWPPSSRR